jgi:hypothetical protein
MLMGGLTLQESILQMIPEAWQGHASMDQAKRDFYEYLSTLMEPWDGPASIAFTDGKYIGAVLDRNGLRPSRYYITDDDKCIMASEVGVVPVEPEHVVEKGRLQPGRVFLIDFEQGRMIPDEEVKGDFARRHPFGEWLAEQRIDLRDLEPNGEPHGFDPETLLPRMQAFGYTVETMQFMLMPLVRELRDPLGSMGNDSALAVLSDKPRMLYDYFKQLFAQVTNPAIDSIREEVIMALQCYIGPEGNLLTTEPEHAHRLWVPHPVLTNEELAALKHMDHRGWTSRVIDITFEKGSGAPGLQAAIDRICAEASAAIEDGASLVVLSDRGIGPDRVPVSSLLAVGALHHHLVNENTRTKIGIVLESGEAREVHHLCCLVGFGVDAVNPYLAFEALWQPIPLEEVEPEAEIVKRFATGAMSYGSISKEAHETLAIAMNRIGGKSNTGEGGEDPARWTSPRERRLEAQRHQAGGLRPLRRDHQLPDNADEIQIKIAQGAKPGEGGELPGHKVDDIIASVRHSTPGVGLISPPPHHDIYSIEDWRSSSTTSRTPTPRRASTSSWRRGRLSGRSPPAWPRPRRTSSSIIAGHDGGTGASPLTSIKHAGLPWELGSPRRTRRWSSTTCAPRGAADRRPAEDRPRRRHRRAPGRRGVRLRHGAARGPRLHHDAQVPPEHLPGRHRHAGSASCARSSAAARARRELLLHARRGAAHDHGGARLPDRLRDGRPRGLPRGAISPSRTGRRRASISRRSSRAPEPEDFLGSLRHPQQDHGLDSPSTTAHRTRRAGPRARRAVEIDLPS